MCRSYNLKEWKERIGSKPFTLMDLPEFRRFQMANPGKKLHEKNTIIMYGRAIHWLCILDIISPNFEKTDFYTIEIGDIIHNDPDCAEIPIEFYNNLGETIFELWELQLKKLYPGGDWEIRIWDDPEMTLEVTIRKR